jgi:hypothetical protein
VEWVRAWAPHAGDRLVEIANYAEVSVDVEVVRQRLMSDFHPYMVEVYVARDGSEACISLSQSTEYCAQTAQ